MAVVTHHLGTWQYFSLYYIVWEYATVMVLECSTTLSMAKSQRLLLDFYLSCR